LSESTDVSGENKEKVAELDAMIKAYMEEFNANIRPREYVSEDK